MTTARPGCVIFSTVADGEPCSFANGAMQSQDSGAVGPLKLRVQSTAIRMPIGAQLVDKR